MIDRIEINETLDNKLTTRFKKIRTALSVLLTAIVCTNIFDKLNSCYVLDDVIKLAYYGALILAVYGIFKQLINIIKINSVHLKYKCIHLANLLLCSIANTLTILILLDRIKYQFIQEVIFILLVKELMIDLSLNCFAKLYNIRLEDLGELQ